MPIDPDVTDAMDDIPFALPNINSLTQTVNQILISLGTRTSEGREPVDVNTLPLLSVDSSLSEFVAAYNNMREAVILFGLARAPE